MARKNQAVILLSSEHNNDKVNGEDKTFKPKIILHYNETKGAVATTDQLAQKYTTQRKTARWPMAIWYQMIAVSAIDAFKLWMLVNPYYRQGHLDTYKKKVSLDFTQ